MAHWFHRNPIKATENVSFDLKGVLTSPTSHKICNELRSRRERLLDYFKDASSDMADVEDEFKRYLSAFSGFLIPIDSQNGEDIGSKLAPVVSFKWTQSMLGNAAFKVSDSWFEAINMCVNMALWLTKSAAWTAGKDEVYEGDAKRVHTALRRAAGIFIFVQDNKDKITGLTSVSGSDFDPAVISAYICQCKAEAQEVTVARAIELKHSASLISALANETSSIFSKADCALDKLDKNIFGKWRWYLQLKAQVYLAYAYAFLGESLLSEDKCGDAVRACREGLSCLEVAKNFSSLYLKTQGPGIAAKPATHLFFRRVEPLLKRHLEKAERENGFIYHQKVPTDCPSLDRKAAFGLAQPETFSLPSPSSDWTVSSYASFDLSKARMPDFSKMKKCSKDLPSVQEKKVYQTDKDQNNRSGCVIS
uniref:BRO1 domain-containing protein n=1 Tax=Syphacia muris TaxID=451379 RepID=A0A0N5AKY0_9BILA